MSELDVLIERTCDNCGRPSYRIGDRLTHDSGIDAVLRNALSPKPAQDEQEDKYGPDPYAPNRPSLYGLDKR